VELHVAGGYTGSEVAELFGVSHSTVYRAVQRSRTPTHAPDSTRATALKTARPRLHRSHPDGSSRSSLMCSRWFGIR
jgi:transposase